MKLSLSVSVLRACFTAKSSIRIVKLSAIFFTAISLNACSSEPEDITHDFVLPDELSHCSIHVLKDGVTKLHVVHCPNATVTSSVANSRILYSVATISE